jgi:hypothetical protein
MEEIPLKKMVIAKLVKKFPAIYGRQTFMPLDPILGQVNPVLTYYIFTINFTIKLPCTPTHRK